jgi:hypothetical protein
MKTINSLKYQFERTQYADEEICKLINHLGGSDYLNQTLTSDQKVKYYDNGVKNWFALRDARWDEGKELSDWDAPNGVKITVRVGTFSDNTDKEEKAIKTVKGSHFGGALIECQMTKELQVVIPFENLSVGTEFKFRKGEEHGFDVYIELDNGEKVLPTEYALNILAGMDTDLDNGLAELADENGVLKEGHQGYLGRQNIHVGYEFTSNEEWTSDKTGVENFNGKMHRDLDNPYDCRKKCCWKDDSKKIKQELTVLGDFS